MSYTVQVVAPLGPSFSAIALEFQPLKADLTATGAALLTLYAEQGTGMGIYAAVLIVPDDALFVCVQKVSDHSVLALAALNPADRLAVDTVGAVVAASLIGYVPPLDAAAVSAAALDVTTAAHQSAGTIGKAIADAGAGGDPTTITAGVKAMLPALLTSEATTPSSLLLLLATKAGLITTAGVSVLPVTNPTDLLVYQDRDYSLLNGAAPRWTGVFSAESLAGASVTISYRPRAGEGSIATVGTGVVVMATGTQEVVVPLLRAELGAIAAGKYKWELHIVQADGTKLPPRYLGTLTVAALP